DQETKRDSATAIYALDADPFQHKLCFANASGRLQLWDYQKQNYCSDRILAEYDLNESEIDHLVLKPSARIEQIATPIPAYPTFGSPLRKISILPKLDDNSNEEYIYFMTTDKIDLQHLPLTGVPYDQMAIIAHPNRVCVVRASYDGQY
ncbi:unnamed protein product, partial [Rotaria sp. Silwood1]